MNDTPTARPAPVRVYIQNAPVDLQFELVVEYEGGLVEQVKPRVMAHDKDLRPEASEAAKQLAFRRGYQLRLSTIQPHLGPLLRTGADAVAAGERYYMPDTPCKNGHPSAYYAKGTKCVVCTQVRNNVLRPSDKAPDDWAKAVRSFFLDNADRALDPNRDEVMRALVVTTDNVPMHTNGMPNRDLFNAETVAKYADAISARLALKDLDDAAAAAREDAEKEHARAEPEISGNIIDDRHTKTHVQLAQDMAPFDAMYDDQYGVESGTVNRWRVEAAQQGEEFVMPDIPLGAGVPVMTPSQPTAGPAPIPAPVAQVAPEAVEPPAAPPVDLSALSGLSLPADLPVSAPASPMAPVPPPTTAQSEVVAPAPAAPPAQTLDDAIEDAMFTIVEGET